MSEAFRYHVLFLLENPNRKWTNENIAAIKAKETSLKQRLSILKTKNNKVIEFEKNYIPIEVRWTENPSEKDCRHLMVFLEEYSNAEKGYIVCQTPKRFLINKKITAIPWQEIPEILLDHM